MSERRTLRCAEDQSRLDLCYGIPGQTELAPLGRVIIKPKAHAKWAVSMQHGVICTYQLPSFGVALLNARARCSKSRRPIEPSVHTKSTSVHHSIWHIALNFTNYPHRY
ncbi:hypothetical protein CGMCC3_g3705 [Colletotrichum fructicola]|nr:uncharacterized protein CGMCC3_g3705 [Colletotrichum fructicola]KAE9580234.1 hypothetical protein CGMCC3_g3705 [Colletotrichum fructicola]KAF5490555.1 hypothetical protein CGCF413_v010842 [Colletotrichum fructicola]